MSEIIGNGIFVGGKSPILVTKTINANGTYNAEDDDADGYGSVTVNVSGGAQGVYFGTTAPESSLGSDGDYYYQRSTLGIDNGIKSMLVSGGSG